MGPPPPPIGQPPLEVISPPEPPAHPPRRQLTGVDLKEFRTPDLIELLHMIADEMNERCAQAALADNLRVRFAALASHGQDQEVTEEDGRSRLPIADEVEEEIAEA